MAQSLVSACAEIEVTAEIIKRTGKAIDAEAPTEDVEVAQLGTSPAAQSATATSTAVSPLLEPAPHLFDRTGTANWDGKRTLQGIWVAHPEAQVARRVRIFNDTTGLAVDGALFKRDGTVGEEDILISSQAAEQLALTPGVATQLRIVAVRPAKRTAAATETEDTADQAPDPAEPALEEAAPAPLPAIVEPEPEPDVTVAADTPVEEAPVVAVLTEPTIEEPATVEPRVEAETVEAPDTESSDVAIVRPAARVIPPKQEQEPATAPAKPKPAQETEPAEEVEFKWEDAPETASNGATATQTKPEPTEAAAKPEIARATSAETPAAAPQKTPDGPGTLTHPFVQAGIFGVPENAAKLVRQLEERGVPAKALAVRSNSRLQRVLAGPFTDRAKRDAAQKTIRGLGLRDAVPVRR